MAKGGELKLTMTKIKPETRAKAKAAAAIKGQDLQDYVDETLNKESEKILAKVVNK